MIALYLVKFFGVVQLARSSTCFLVFCCTSRVATSSPSSFGLPHHQHVYKCVSLFVACVLYFLGYLPGVVGVPRPQLWPKPSCDARVVG
jgi:hypothetical protein